MVSKMCQLPFSIGKSYQCKFTWDVVDMDACHLLVGRPWEFDQNVNTLEGKIFICLHEKNKKIVLLPFNLKSENQLATNLIVINGISFHCEV